MTKRKPRTEQLEAPTDAQLASGDYRRQYVTHVESNTRVMAHIAAHSPVERWKKAGMMSDPQMSAIELVRGLWAKTEQPQKLCASYGQRIAGNTECASNAEIDARRRLHAIIDYIPGAYWSVFEHVCRFDEAAEKAGLRLRYSPRVAAAKAHVVVCFVADVIAMNERL